jgi:hypothetical protein
VLVLADPIVSGITCASTFLYPNILVAFWAPLIFLAFLSSSHDRDELGVVLLGVGTGLDV